jgi:hypothetical protein
MHHRLARLLAGILLVFAVAATSAQATLVNVRVEGPTSTIFEGWVDASAGRWHYSDAPSTTYQCDGMAGKSASEDVANPSPKVTSGNAVMAVESLGVSFVGPWYSELGPGFSQIGGQSVSYDGASGKYLTEFHNGIFQDVGMCFVPVSDGDRVLLAFAEYGAMALSLTGPASANVGETVPFVVRNAANNVGQAGASVAGATSDANGVANAVFPGVGTYTLKAEKPGAVRSNGVTICVHNGNDGNCGFPLDPGVAAPPPAQAEAPPAPPSLPAPPTTPIAPSIADTAAPIATIAGVRNRQHFRKRKAPRELKGSVTDGSSLKSVELRLHRKKGKRCFAFSGQRERFVRLRCSRDAAWFSVGTKADWSYLLPARLRKGLYQLQVRATDDAGNQSAVQSLRFRVA